METRALSELTSLSIDISTDSKVSAFVVPCDPSGCAAYKNLPRYTIQERRRTNPTEAGSQLHTAYFAILLNTNPKAFSTVSNLTRITGSDTNILFTSLYCLCFAASSADGSFPLSNKIPRRGDLKTIYRAGAGMFLLQGRMDGWIGALRAVMSGNGLDNIVYCTYETVSLHC